VTDAAEQSETELWRREKSPRWKVLDPAGEDRGDRDLPPVYSTVYVADELIISVETADTTLSRLRQLADDAGWFVDEEVQFEDPYFDGGGLVSRPPDPEGSRRLRFSVGDNRSRDIVAATPDAWELLRQLQHNDEAAGVTLNHVLTTDSLGVNPFKANPFKANPFKANPFKANPFKANAAGVGIDSYAMPGFGGRQPVAYLGPDPIRSSMPDAERPVVAILDTGLGAHRWFNAGVTRNPRLASGEPIGIVDAPSDPERYPSLATPLDGIFDDAAGHGTFIAGIVRQRCPDADLLSIRVSDGEGNIVETDLIGALQRLITYHVEGNRVDVVNLSFSYYHETPDDPNTVSAMRGLLTALRDRGIVVVCSAGNEATDRPTFPAALDADPPRHISVGALNPATRSVALFSNIGTWVDVFAPGVSLVSTAPVDFDGGIQAGTRDDLYGHPRMTLDIDDFRGGFGVWSGTSFAAPVVAARIAGKLLDGADVDAAADEALVELRTEDLSRPT
jgi:serine protease